MNNTYTGRYRRESTILNGNQNASSLNQPLIPGNVSNLKSHLLQLQGAGKDSKYPGHYLGPGNQWIQGRIPRLQEELKLLEEQFNKYAQSQLLIGNPKPKVWPDDLQEKKLKSEARLEIANAEVKELQRLLTQTQEQQAKAKPSLLSHPRHWGSGQLRDGQLVEIGPWKVAMHPEKKVLCIRDDSSQYDGLEIHRFRTEITKPMGMEYSHRQRQEEQEAVAENRKRKQVAYPKPGNWNRDTDLIEYEDYSNETIKKLKQSE